jgi:protein-disulfide isomerase
VKRYYFVIIPIIITIVAVYYMATPHENKSNDLTPQMIMQNGSPILGDPNAKVTIVEFGDYQCTYCHLFHVNTKDALLQQYVDTGKANFVFRDFPLNGPDSVLAAEASYCAGDQDKYWQYHDELYKNWAGEKTGWVNQKSLDKFATTVGLDLGKFDKCMSDNKYEQKVLDNQKFGENIGIDGTPSFIIFSGKNITKVVGAQPITVFQQVIDKFSNS